MTYLFLNLQFCEYPHLCVLPVCVSGTRGSWKKVLDPIETEFYVILSHHVVTEDRIQVLQENKDSSPAVPSL